MFYLGNKRSKSTKRQRLGSSQGFSITKRFKTPSRLDRGTPFAFQDNRLRCTSSNRRRSELPFKNPQPDRFRDNTLNVSDGVISPEGLQPNKNMTVLIMTLKDTKQLFDVLGTLTPQANDLGPNIQVLQRTISPPSATVAANNYIRSPCRLKDSMALNTQRIYSKPESGGVENGVVEGGKHNKSNFQNLNCKNQNEKYSINPQKVNMHNLKKLGRGADQTLRSPLDHRVKDKGQRSKNNRVKSVRFNRPTAVQADDSMVKGSVGFSDIEFR